VVRKVWIAYIDWRDGRIDAGYYGRRQVLIGVHVHRVHRKAAGGQQRDQPDKLQHDLVVADQILPAG